MRVNFSRSHCGWSARSTVLRERFKSEKHSEKNSDRRSASTLPVRRRLRCRRAGAAPFRAVPKSNSRKSPIRTESTWAGRRLRWNFSIAFWCGADSSRDTPFHENGLPPAVMAASAALQTRRCEKRLRAPGGSSATRRRSARFLLTRYHATSTSSKPCTFVRAISVA
jgi:hypothetical protein